MLYLAKNKGFIPLKEVSQKEEIPFDFLEKIFSELEKTGLVKGKKGTLGGYSLAKKPKSITVFDILNTLENTLPVKCFGCQRVNKCSAKSVWKKISNSLNNNLKSIKLSNLI